MRTPHDMCHVWMGCKWYAHTTLDLLISPQQAWNEPFYLLFDIHVFHEIDSYPQNKPQSKEKNSCLKFLKNEIENLPNLKYLIALGTIAHKAIIKCYNLKQKEFNFAHGKKHLIKENLTLLDSYHCSRYNVNTGRLTKEMFEEIFIILSR